MRKFAIGDIHGRFDKLEDLMKKISPAEEDTFIFLGDYIDRGPDAKKVIDYLLELSKISNCVFITGNHEQMLHGFLTREDTKLFLKNGGVPTIDSYTNGNVTLEKSLKKLMNDDLSSEQSNALYHEIAKTRIRILIKNIRPHLEFFSNLKWYHEDEDYIYVHAGIRPGRPMDKQDRNDLIWIRYEFIVSDTRLDKKVIYGHTPSEDPVVLKDKICIDTGSFDPRGMLTAIQLPEETFIHSFRG